MGFGDSLIVTSIVKKAKLRHPDRPIVVGDGTSIKWCEVFDNNPKIATKITPDCVWVKAVKGNRPYIDYSKTTLEKTVWRPYKVSPGEIFLRPSEISGDRDFVYIEPNVKGTFGRNKDWGFDRWQTVVDLLPNVRFIQGRGRKLRGVEQRETQSFRHACGLLLHARLFVGTDGGLHHAAAALGKPAVVLWGGLVPPEILGYDSHINLCKAKSFCGSTPPCLHCRQSLEKITPEEVKDAIERSLRDLSTRSRATPVEVCGGTGLELSEAQA